MSEEWFKVARLQADGVLLVEDGNHGEYRPRRDEFSGVGCAFIRAADLRDGRVLFGSASKINDAALSRIRKGIGQSQDVLLSHKGTVGKVALVERNAPPFVCSPQTTFYRSLDHGRLDPRYLYFFLQSPGFSRQLRAREGETDMAAYVSLTEQRQLLLHVPPINLQRAIAEVLGALDDKIDANGRLVPLLRDLAKALLLRAAEGGQTYVVGDVADVWKGLSYTGAGLADSGMPMVNLANAEELGWLKRSGFKYYTGPFKPRHMAAPGSLLVSGVDLTWKLRIVGWPMLLPEDIGPALFSHHVFVITFSDDRSWLRLPLWASLHGADARGRLEGMVYGTTVATLPAEALTGMAFSAPPPGSPVVSLAEDLLRRAWAAERESIALANLRDALLPPLMSGDLQVREAEALVTRG